MEVGKFYTLKGTDYWIMPEIFNEIPSNGNWHAIRQLRDSDNFLLIATVLPRRDFNFPGYWAQILIQDKSYWMWFESKFMVATQLY